MVGYARIDVYENYKKMATCEICGKPPKEVVVLTGSRGAIRMCSEHIHSAASRIEDFLIKKNAPTSTYAEINLEKTQE